MGGHAYTEKIIVDQREIAVDIGVEHFSEKQAPNFFALLNRFGIETFVAPLSFGAAYNHKEDYWSNIGINGPLWDRIYTECSRFHIQMHEVMYLYNPAVTRMTLGTFLKIENYSNEFIYGALMPLLTVFSSGHSPLLEYSLTFCALSFSTGLLSFFHPTYWRKIKGGISSYLEQISEELKGKIYLNSKVLRVERNASKVWIHLYNGQKYDFDEVVFATHADSALSLISNPTEDEKDILGRFEYTAIECMLHSDCSLLIPAFGAKVHCEFHGIDLKQDCLNGTLTRVIHALEPYKHTTLPLMVSFDAKMTCSLSLTHLKKQWKIPKLRPQDMVNKKRIQKLQGINRTWFCGTDTSFTGHEGAIVSGLVIADALGAAYPFIENNWAKMQYDMVKGIMGIYSPYEKVRNAFTNSMYSIGNALGVCQPKGSKVLLDLYA